MIFLDFCIHKVICIQIACHRVLSLGLVSSGLKAPSTWPAALRTPVQQEQLRGAGAPPAVPPRVPRAAWTRRAPRFWGCCCLSCTVPTRAEDGAPGRGGAARSQPCQVPLSHAGGQTQTFATTARGPQRQPAAETTNWAALVPGPQQNPAAVLLGGQPWPERCQSHRHLGNKATLCRCPGTDRRWFWCCLPLPQDAPPRGSAPPAVYQHRSRSCHTHTRLSPRSSHQHCPAGENTRELSPSGSACTSRPRFVLVRGICNAAEMEEVKKADAE